MVDACKMEMHIAIDPGTHASLGMLATELKISRNVIAATLLDKLVAGDTYLRDLIMRARAEKAVMTGIKQLQPESIYELIEMDNPLANR